MSALFSTSDSEWWATQHSGDGTQEGFCFHVSIAFGWEAELDGVNEVAEIHNPI